MTTIAPGLENLSLDITEELFVRSSLVATFDALLEEIGPSNKGHNITLHHSAFGLFPDGYRENLATGTQSLFARIKRRAEQG